MNRDTNINRKSNLISQIKVIDDIPIFSIVEFNITELCNRKCKFCPRYDNLYENRNENIDISTYKNIMSMLRDINYNGNIIYSAFGEPIMHNNIYELIETTKEYIPRCHLEIITNGDFIDDDNIMKLYEKGLDTLLFSLYDGEHQIDIIENFKEKYNLSDNQITFRKRYKSDEIIYSNRAGLLSNIDKPINNICLYPFYQLTVDYDGSVLFCPHDWRKRVILGNVNKDSILDIWNGNILTEIRKKLIDNNRNFIPCNECDVIGDLMGKEHLEIWMKYYERN